MEDPRPGVESELQPVAYATAGQDLSRICELHYSSWQHQSLNPLSEPRNWTATSWFLVGSFSTVPQWELLKFLIIQLNKRWRNTLLVIKLWIMLLEWMRIYPHERITVPLWPFPLMISLYLLFGSMNSMREITLYLLFSDFTPIQSRLCCLLHWYNSWSPVNSLNSGFSALLSWKISICAL